MLLFQLSLFVILAFQPVDWSLVPAKPRKGILEGWHLQTALLCDADLTRSVARIGADHFVEFLAVIFVTIVLDAERLPCKDCRNLHNTKG